MLSFQVIDAGRAVNVFCDAKGMAILLGALAKLIAERASHVICVPPEKEEMN